MRPPALILASSRYAPRTRHTPHAHEELHISFVLRGELREGVGGEHEGAGPLSAVVKDPGVVHADEFGPEGAVMAQLSVRRTVLAELIDDPSRAQGWRWAHAGIAAAPFLRLVMRGMAGQRRFAADDDDVADLLAIMSARPHAGPSGDPPAWLRDAVTHMQEGWRPGLSVRDVADASGVHPVYLARCLRRWCGVAGGDLMRRARLRHAAHAIADGSQTISAVAHASGFADEAHLCREFSKATGVTPARFRRLGRDFAAIADRLDRIARVAG